MEMDDSPNFYEGAEKLLEIWFEPITFGDVTDVKWLRTISRYYNYVCVLQQIDAYRNSLSVNEFVYLT